MNRLVLFFSFLLLSATFSFGGFLYTDWPYASYPGDPDPTVETTAIHMSSNAIVAWADGYTDLVYGDAVDAAWRTPEKALGAAVGTSMDIVCLGRGGQITMTFSRGITDGDGFDFAVFENGFSDTFLELSWVEVSSDGTNFVRFPDVSYTAEEAQTVLARDVNGLAGKYKQGYGTPFDLSELADVAAYISTNGANLSLAYKDAFATGWPFLDLNDVRYVRLIDVVGDGTALCSAGTPVYDPYPMSGSAGFDLDAIGVINQPVVAGDPQEIMFKRIPHQKVSFGGAALEATASSGLPVEYSVQSGPATNAGNVVYFTGTGTVEVVANQSGDATYAPASPVMQSFVVAEEVQSIFIEQLPNLLQGSGPVQVRAYSSRGLPVRLQVYSGPDAVTVGETDHVLDTAGEIGMVTLWARQPGDATTAPAEDYTMKFEIVASGSDNAPIPLDQWMQANELPDLNIMRGQDAYGRDAVELDYVLDMTMSAQASVLFSTNLISWDVVVPDLLMLGSDEGNPWFRVLAPASATNGFFRLEFEEL